MPSTSGTLRSRTRRRPVDRPSATARSWASDAVVQGRSRRREGGQALLEFAIVLPHTSGSMAVRVAERIREAAKQFVFLADEHPLKLTVSAGVATFPTSPGVDSPDALIRAADEALYRAKQAGKDRVVDASGRDGKPPIDKPAPSLSGRADGDKGAAASGAGTRPARPRTHKVRDPGPPTASR